MSQILETNREIAAPNAVASSANFVTPSATVRPGADGYTLAVNLPGVPKSGVEITFDDGTLTVTGNRCEPAFGEIVYRESADAGFRRAFSIDPAIDPAGISAAYEQGVLTVHLPKAESARPRQIPVN